MSLRFTHLVKKRWPISIRYDTEIIFVEVTSINKQLVMKVIEQLFQDCYAVILSQYVDTRYWGFGDKDLFLNDFREKFPVEIFLASDYTDLSTPDKESIKFTMNIIGRMDSEILNRATSFGTSNIPNILYGIMHQPTDWREELSQWNSLIIRWFNLELEQESQLVEFINRIKYLAINIDGNYFFCFTKLALVNRFLKIVSQLSTQNNYHIELRLNPMQKKVNLAG